MSKTIGVDPNRVFGLQKDYSEKIHTAMKNNDKQFFDCFEAFLKANYQQKETFIKEVLKRESSTESFIVGKVFQEKVGESIPKNFGDNFKNWLWTPSQAKTVSINAFGFPFLKQYILPKAMNDTAILNAVSSLPMELNQFWAVLYLLIISPKFGKKILKYKLWKYKVYIFHVELASRIVAVSVGWDEAGWALGASNLDSYDWWEEINVFLFFASA
ncbi:MAG: hypothetical protein AAB493_00505 [Patescibacteria group bacterium]